MEIVLSIAGSDPSAGAGIQQDLKTVTALGCYGATVITAITVQNTLGVTQVMEVPPDIVEAQLRAVLDDFDVRAIKMGMIPNRQVAEAIVRMLQPFVAQKASLAVGQRSLPVVYDPVMVSTSGHRLMSADSIDYICRHLFPLCTLITPNLPETEVLAGQRLSSPDDIGLAGRSLVERYGCAFLLKGGHNSADRLKAVDHLFCADGTVHTFSAPRIASRNLHGTGCTLSSAIAARMAQGDSLPQGVAQAKACLTSAIERSTNHDIGHGNGPLILG